MGDRKKTHGAGKRQLLPTPRLPSSVAVLLRRVDRRAGIAGSFKLIGKIEGRGTTAPLGRRKKKQLIADSSQGKLGSSHFQVLKKSSGSIPACFRIALSVPSGISPE
jgi:hypothetical protein